MIQEREGKVIGEINHFFLHYLSSSADVTELRSLPPLLMFAQSLGSNVIFYLRTSISVTSRHIKQDILTTNSDPSHNFPSLNSSQYVCTSLSYHECLSGCWWWDAGHWAQEEVSVYGRSHSLSVSGVRTRSDHHHPSLILIPGCRVCCVLILLLPPSLRRVVLRVSEPFTGTITMSPGSRHQHQTHREH